MMGSGISLGRKNKPRKMHSSGAGLTVSMGEIYTKRLTSKYRKAKTQDKIRNALPGLWKKPRSTPTAHLSTFTHSQDSLDLAPSPTTWKCNFFKGILLLPYSLTTEQYSSQDPKPWQSQDQLQLIFPRSRVFQSRVPSVKTAKASISYSKPEARLRNKEAWFVSSVIRTPYSFSSCSLGRIA